MIETSGERPLARLPGAVHKIVDVKCPASGEGGSFFLPNLQFLTQRDEVKFVIADRADYDFAKQFMVEHGLEERVGNILLSPAFSKTPTTERSAANMQMDPRILVEWMLEDCLQARLSLQIHKFVWEPATKGV
jgi:7-carboxy-7-deazaguanine synthase